MNNIYVNDEKVLDTYIRTSNDITISKTVDGFITVNIGEESYSFRPESVTHFFKKPKMFN